MLVLQMSSTEDSANSGSSSEGPPILNLADAVVLLAKYKAIVANEAPMVNPDLLFQKMTGHSGWKSICETNGSAWTTCVCLLITCCICITFYLGFA